MRPITQATPGTSARLLLVLAVLALAALLAAPAALAQTPTTDPNAVRIQELEAERAQLEQERQALQVRSEANGKSLSFMYGLISNPATSSPGFVDLTAIYELEARMNADLNRNIQIQDRMNQIDAELTQLRSAPPVTAPDPSVNPGTPPLPVTVPSTTPGQPLTPDQVQQRLSGLVPGVNPQQTVEWLYLSALTREPTAEERDQLTSNLQQAPFDAARRQVVADAVVALLTSDEYVAFELPDEDFVTDVFFVAFADEPTQEELDQWTGRLQDGTSREDMLVELLSGPDGARLPVPSSAFTGQLPLISG